MMARTIFFNLVFLSIACISSAVPDKGCKKPKEISCQTDKDCIGKKLADNICIDKHGKGYKTCTKCLCKETSQCIWNGKEMECKCGAGFYGKRCECQNETRPCDQNVCQYGHCVDVGEMYKCKCNSGWKGTFCDTVLDKCLSQPCGIGECINGSRSIMCKCPQGYIANCEGIDPQRSNVLIGGTITATSNKELALYAIDGDISKSNCHTYSSSASDTKPYLRVKLVTKFKINTIHLQVCPGDVKWLSRIKIYVGRKYCGYFGGTSDDKLRLIVIRCEYTITGDDIIVKKTGTNLKIAEIEGYYYQ